MKQQEKKKRRGGGRRQSKSTTLSLPIDLTSEILLRLPEKSIARFRCVSKLWSSITTDPYFINLFESRSPRPSLLICFQKDDKLFVSSIPQHTFTLHQDSNKLPYSSSKPLDSYHIELTGGDIDYLPTESVHGLICFQQSGNPLVLNPSKKQLLTLPKPRKRWNDLTVFLGYDPVEGKHKVVCLPLNRSTDVCRVLTLGSSAQESWRTVKTNLKHRCEFYTSGRCINGVIYYVAYIYHTRVWVVMSFDVRSEKFDMIDLPTEISNDVLITYDGRLACLDRNKNFRRLWILEDARKHKWSSQDFLSPFGHHDKSLITNYLSLKGFTHAGEFVFLSSVFRNSSCALFYDPVRDSYRRFEFKELADDGSSLHNGIQYLLHAFPNHIETQISLL